MPDSPLEIYANAYNLQYHEEKIAEACILYKQIVKNFPDSKECAYSAIQLEKIAAIDLVEDKPGYSKNHIFLTILLILNLLFTFSAISTGAYYIKYKVLPVYHVLKSKNLIP